MSTNLKILVSAFLFLFAISTPAVAQQPPAPGLGSFQAGAPAQMGPLKGDHYHANLIWLGSINYNGFLYEPDDPGPKQHIALVFAYPRDFSFSITPASEMAKRGYRVLLTAHHGLDLSPLDGDAEISRAITYLRTVPGVEKVVVMAHSGGGRMLAGYANIALNGPAACQGPDVIYPCKTVEVAGWAKPDGVILLDPGLGSVEGTSGIDPAWDGTKRIPELDMFSPANGFDPKTGNAKYSANFIKRFYAAQSARNMQLVNYATERLKLIEQGKSSYKDDEPLVIPAASNAGRASRLFQSDTSLFSHTKKPHTLLKADGTTTEEIIHSVRPPSGRQDESALSTLADGTLNTTVRIFLANYATRTTPDYALTADDATGIDWHSSNRSTPASSEGITVPTLVLTMSCFYLVVPGEIAYDHLAAKDKTYASIEGANHNFDACKPEYGDTVKRSFDYLDTWLSKPGRF